MSEEERIDMALQDYVDHLRARRAACPAPETLAALQEGTLATDRTGQVQEHVETCGRCQALLSLIDTFERRANAEIEEPSGWLEIEKQGQERFHAFLESRAKTRQKQKMTPGILDVLKPLLFRPVVAYLVALALVYPAYLGILGKPDVVSQREIVDGERASSAPGAPTLPLLRLRPAERATGLQKSVVQLSEDDVFFALSFFMPISERPEFIYDLEIRDPLGRVVFADGAATPQDRLGNFFVVCNRELFPPAEYELHVREVSKSTLEARREYTFSFAVN